MVGETKEEEKRQVLHAQFEATLRPIEEWAKENRLRCRLKRLPKHKIVGGISYGYRLTVWGFKGKGGATLLTEFVNLVKGFRWEDMDTGYAQREIVGHKEVDQDAKGKVAT